MRPTDLLRLCRVYLEEATEPDGDVDWLHLQALRGEILKAGKKVGLTEVDLNEGYSDAFCVDSGEVVLRAMRPEYLPLALLSMWNLYRIRCAELVKENAEFRGDVFTDSGPPSYIPEWVNALPEDVRHLYLANRPVVRR